MFPKLMFLILVITARTIINASESVGFNTGSLFSDTRFGLTNLRINSISPYIPEEEPIPEIYAGGFFGVRARVELIREHNLAYIILEGVPLGGRVAGTARFALGTTDGSVDLSEGLARTVRRRGVQIVGVEDDTANENEIYIKIKLPVVGVQCLKMTRTNEEITSPSKQVLVRRGGSSENEEIATGNSNDFQSNSGEKPLSETKSKRKRLLGYLKKKNLL